MVKRQRGPLLPMNIGFSSTLTWDAVLVTAHHTTDFPFSNFCGSCASGLATPRYKVLAEGGILRRAVRRSFKKLKGSE